MDNSGTKKEKVCRTYKGHGGYAPIAAYIGLEGWCLEVELRPGSQHSQEGFLPFMKRVFKKAKPLLEKNYWYDSTQPMMLWKPAFFCAKLIRSPLSSNGIRDGKTPVRCANEPLPKEKSHKPQTRKTGGLTDSP